MARTATGGRGEKRYRRREDVRWALERGPALAGQVGQALHTVRGEAFFDGPQGTQAWQVIEQSLALASLPFYPASLSLTAYAPSWPVDGSYGLKQAVRNPAFNMFFDFFRDSILPDIARTRPDLVGVSIPSLGQMLAGATLAYLIKQARLPCHIVAGGPHVTMLRDALLRAPAFFDLFDSAVVFEGEEPLLRLAETVAGRHNLGTVPNLIYRDGQQIRRSEQQQPVPAGGLPTPDFDGLSLDGYLAPQRVLPLLSAHGCYHGKCAFCNVGYGLPGHYRPLPPERVVEQMLGLRDRYGARHIFFADEALPPRHLRYISETLVKQGTPLAWCGCARMERTLSPDLLGALARGGCTMLLFGLETASEPIIQRMVKGTERNEMGRVLDAGAAAGIWNHTFFFFGFPGETIEHAQETVDFLYEHQMAVHSASPGTFVLEIDSPAHRAPAEYGIRRVVASREKDLAIYFDYEVESGMDARDGGSRRGALYRRFAGEALPTFLRQRRLALSVRPPSA